MRRIEKYSHLSGIIFGSIFTIVSLIILGLALILAPNNTEGEYAKANNAVINEVVEFYNYDYLDEYGDPTLDHKVYVDYDTEDGTHYTHIEFNAYDITMKPGKEIDVLYNINNPSEAISSGGGMFIFILVALIFAAIGIIILVVSIKRYRRGKKNNAFDDEAVSTNHIDDELFEVHDLTKLYFRPKDNFYHTFEIITKNENKKMYSNLIKWHLFKANEVEFKNVVNGTTRQHKIGKLVGVSTDDVVSESHFSFDGQNVFDYLQSKGVNIELNMDSLIKASYKIVYHGHVVCNVKSTTKKDLFNDDVNTKVGFRGFYQIEADENYLDIIFISLITIALVDPRMFL